MSYQRIGANIEARKHKSDGIEYLYFRVPLQHEVEDDEGNKTIQPKTLGKSSSGKSELLGSTRGNQDLGMVSDDLIDVVAGINVYRPIPKDER